ncbi:MAG: glycerol-3-phosphate 1-O-acyltransferase PlsY [Candidatus Aenigmatarchaeota archaeon]
MSLQIFLTVLAYLLGSIPTGLLISKYIGGVDIRNIGSGNIGATNVLRAMGSKYGAITLLADALKGFIPVILAILLLDSPPWIGFVMVASVLGHTFPVFLKFRGGKGVATGFGALLALKPSIAILLLVLFVVVVIKWRYVSLGSLTAAATLPIFLALSPDPRSYFIAGTVVSMLVFWRHKENIKRLWDGVENKVDINTIVSRMPKF